MARTKVKLKWKYDEKGPNYEVNMHVNLGRFGKQFQNAQNELDSMVMMDMIPYMPKQTGNFIDVTKIMSESLAGTGIVVAAAPPRGRFLYEAKNMVDEKTGSPWARKAAKKVLATQHPSTKAKPNLEYNKSENPDAQDHWFDAAKKENLDIWVKKTKETAGGG